MEVYFLLAMSVVGLLVVVWFYGKHVGLTESSEKVLDDVETAKRVEEDANSVSVDDMRNSLRKPDT